MESQFDPKFPRADGDPRGVVEGQLRECYGRVVYSHKTHEKCADILLARHSAIKLWQMVLSAATTAGIIATFFGTGHWGTGLAMVISTALLVLNAYVKQYDLGQLAQQHRRAAAGIWRIREGYLSLLTDLGGNLRSLDDVLLRRDKLLEELHETYKGAPSTNFAAYRKAQTALQRNDDMTFSDSEIDAFLPRELRRSAS